MGHGEWVCPARSKMARSVDLEGLKCRFADRCEGSVRSKMARSVALEGLMCIFADRCE